MVKKCDVLDRKIVREEKKINIRKSKAFHNIFDSKFKRFVKNKISNKKIEKYKIKKKRLFCDN